MDNKLNRFKKEIKGIIPEQISKNSSLSDYLSYVDELNFTTRKFSLDDYFSWVNKLYLKICEFQEIILNAIKNFYKNDKKLGKMLDKYKIPNEARLEEIIFLKIFLESNCHDFEVDYIIFHEIDKNYDAILKTKNNEKIFIEITSSIEGKLWHSLKQHFIRFGYAHPLTTDTPKGISIKLEKGESTQPEYRCVQDSFRSEAKNVSNVIKRKIGKKYPEGTILVVAVYSRCSIFRDPLPSFDLCEEELTRLKKNISVKIICKSTRKYTIDADHINP